jgi:hypothetical protein
LFVDSAILLLNGKMNGKGVGIAGGDFASGASFTVLRLFLAGASHQAAAEK